MTPARLAAPALLALGLVDLGVLHLRLVPALAEEEREAAITKEHAVAPARAAAAEGAPQAAPSAAPVPSSAPITTSAASAPPRRAEEAMPSIRFGLDLTRIDDPAALAALRRVAEELKANPSLRLVVRGHSDRMGSPAHNLMLSHRRAMSVLFYLSARGAPIERISIEAVGGDEPLDPESTPVAWARNRRAEVLWR